MPTKTHEMRGVVSTMNDNQMHIFFTDDDGEDHEITNNETDFEESSRKRWDIDLTFSLRSILYAQLQKLPVLWKRDTHE